MEADPQRRVFSFYDDVAIVAGAGSRMPGGYSSLNRDHESFILVPLFQGLT